MGFSVFYYLIAMTKDLGLARCRSSDKKGGSGLHTRKKSNQNTNFGSEEIKKMGEVIVMVPPDPTMDVKQPSFHSTMALMHKR